MKPSARSETSESGFDQYDERAVKLLPCKTTDECPDDYCVDGYHRGGCPVELRSDVAAALREQGEEIDRLTRVIAGNL